jgi:hypothetical protein
LQTSYEQIQSQEITRVKRKRADKFLPLENFDHDVDINKAWEIIRENNKISAEGRLGYYELKKYKPWFDKGYNPT